MGTIQTQFDIIAAVKMAGAATGLVLQNFNAIFHQCYREDIMPLVIPPLERLGGWLMVDPDRLQNGDNGFQRIPSPKRWNWTSISIVIGLYRGNSSDGDLVGTIGRNRSLIAVFLLLIGCTTCLTVEEASEMMYELMRLNGILRPQEYPIPGRLVSQFNEALNGCATYMVEETPLNIYKLISDRINYVTFERRIDGLYLAGETKELAKIVYEGIERLQNAEIELTVLRGSRQGAWLASLFVWLRPKEVQVQIRDTLIYPMVQAEDHRESNQIRLYIHLDDPKGNPMNSSWSVQSWKAGRQDVPIVFCLKDETNMDFERQHPAPLPSARSQISNTVSQLAVDAIGHLAGALVIVAAEIGYLYDKDRKTARLLKELCSQRFLNRYNTMLTFFGWEGREGLLDQNRQESMAEVLSDIVPNFNFRSGHDELNTLASLIDEACRRYANKIGKPMLLGREAMKIEGSGEDTVIEHAIYLAAEALLFAFCAEMPKYQLYRPFEPFKLDENAKMLVELLRPTNNGGQHPASEPRGYSFWEFRKRAIEVLVPGAANVQSSDLAVAGNGYVVYIAALAEWDNNLTDRRTISSLYLAPGPLKAVEVEGRLSRVTEDSKNPALAGRLLLYNQGIKLYEDEQCCLDERSAINEFPTKIVHLWRIENATGTLHLATYINSNMNHGFSVSQQPIKGDARIPTSWERSMNAVAFAHHIEEGIARPTQLQQLAHEWRKQGKEIQWSVVGSSCLSKQRYITTTSENEQLRFFESGNLVEEHKVFIKHRAVSLLACIKVAMESCQENKYWVIIA
jgi:hypothetical protein